MNRYKIKYLKSVDLYVLHVQRKVAGRKVWRRLRGYSFYTESTARHLAEGNF